MKREGGTSLRQGTEKVKVDPLFTCDCIVIDPLINFAIFLHIFHFVKKDELLKKIMRVILPVLSQIHHIPLIRISNE